MAKIWLSFFKPTGLFEGSFNKFASWWTGGDFCHCELVFEIEPSTLMECVKDRYSTIKNDPEENQSQISTTLEKMFFESRENRKLLQSAKTVFLSFSLVWGDQLRLRMLMNVQDPWYSTPVNEFEDLTWKQLNNIEHKNIIRGLKWSLQEICKPYNTSAAMFSWIPSWSMDNIIPKESYFCSEFCAMVLIHMGYLSPMSVTDCTPNSLWKIIKEGEFKHKEAEVEQKETEVEQDSQETYVETSSEEDN